MQKCFYIEQILETSKEDKLIGIFFFNDLQDRINNSTFVFSCVKANALAIDICRQELEKRGIDCDFFSDKLQNIPSAAQKYLPMFISFFQDEVVRSEGQFVPSFVFITPKQIMDKLYEKGKPSELQIQIAFSFALIRIACYFSKNPQYLQEFPLYEAYLKKHNLLQEQMPLENFLELILNSIDNQISL